MRQTGMYLIKRLLARAGLQLQVYASSSFIPIPLWEQDPVFLKLWRDVERHTVVDRRRCYMLYQYARQVRTIAGDSAEVGVYRGGTARLLARVLAPAGRTLHLYDTFSGMPDTDPAKDLHRAGDFDDTSLSAVQAYLADCANVQFHPGMFPETADHHATSFALVHVDVDIYQSVLDCCRYFYPRMARGGVMLFDDYGIPTCPGAKLAVDTFFADTPEVVCYLPTGQAVVTRL